MGKEDIKIVEKVKFWEEQDKINQVLIPRVLEMHEQIKEVSLLGQKNASEYIQIKPTLNAIENKINDDIKKHQESNQALSKLFDVTMQDIDTRYKGLIVSITELKELIEQHATEQDNKSQELSKLYEALLEKIKNITDTHGQNELKQQAILKKLEKTQDDIKSQDTIIQKSLEKIQEQLTKQLDNKISMLEKTNQELKKSNKELLQEIENIQQTQSEQDGKSQKLNWIAIGLAVLAIIIVVF